ncbi:MAG: PAAR-like protein, partial [Byssovorax sp.]
MPLPLCTGTMLSCTMSLTPTAFIANPLPGAPMINGIVPAATIDQVLVTNIPTFGMCTSPTNP